MRKSCDEVFFYRYLGIQCTFQDENVENTQDMVNTPDLLQV